MNTKPPKEHIRSRNTADAPAFRYPETLWPKGDAIRQLRKNRGLGQSDVATDVDTSQGVISKAENERNTCSTEILQRLANYFEVRLGDVASIPAVEEFVSQSFTGPYSDVLQFAFTNDNAERMPEEFEDFRVLTQQSTTDPSLARFHKLDDASQKYVWDLFCSEGWKQAFFGDGHAACTQWLFAFQQLVETRARLHKVNSLHYSQPNEHVSPSIRKLMVTTSESNEPYENLIEKLQCRFDHIKTAIPKSLDEIGDFCEALLSFDVAIASLTGAVGPLLLELFRPIRNFYRFALLADDEAGDVLMFRQTVELDVAIREAELVSYDARRTHTIDHLGFLNWSNNFIPSAHLMFQAIFLQSLDSLANLQEMSDGGFSSYGGGVSPVTLPTPQHEALFPVWCSPRTSDEFHNFSCKLWEFFVQKDLGKKPVWA